MGYRIYYGKEKAKKYSFLPIQTLFAALFLLLSAGVRIFWPEGTDALRQILVSEELSQSAQAFMSMVENLENGDSVADVVAVFCQEITHGS